MRTGTIDLLGDVAVEAKQLESSISVIMPRDVRCIAEATLCCIPLLCCGSASIPAKMRKGTKDLMGVAL
jgi:hypothetical protein